jgi:type IX secretion system PorP/SprF family membrane protein
MSFGMSFMKRILLVVSVLLVVELAMAQQEAQFSQYIFNQLFFNPAYAGVEGVTKMTAIHRSQWFLYSSTFDGGGAPTTQVLTLSTPILKFNSGVGLHFTNDNLGPVNNLEAQVSGAYHLNINEAKMSFGVRVGVKSQSIDFDKYRWDDETDPLNKSGKESQIRPDMAVGLYYRAEKYFAGVSFNHLLKSEFDFGVDELRNPLENHIFLVAGYHYEFNYDLIITPSILAKTVLDESGINTYSLDLSVIGTYRERLWGGLAFRQSDAAIAMIGYGITKDNALKLGYAFDYIVTGQDAKEPTSHEVLLSYTLPVVSAGGKKIIRTPRFRH